MTKFAIEAFRNAVWYGCGLALHPPLLPKPAAFLHPRNLVAASPRCVPLRPPHETQTSVRQLSPKRRQRQTSNAKTGRAPLLVIDNCRFQVNYRLIVGHGYAPIGGGSPIRLFHIGVLYMDCVFALWNIIKMIQPILACLKGFYFLQIGTAWNSSI